MNEYIESLRWRYATKKFDNQKKVSEEDLNTLKEAIRLTASSYGLQPYRILIVEDPEIRKELQPASWGQTQIVDASHLIVFCTEREVNDDFIDHYLENISSTRKVAIEDLKDYGNFMKSKITPLDPDVKQNWSTRQAYIALGNLLSAAAQLKIDSCPIEGFSPEKYDEILGLKEKGLSSVVVAAIGYRSQEDQTQHFAKVRKPAQELFITI
ncbi:NAD(P)H-dependent oxidoreductase [Leptobacterium flavescens]|uniref:NAD(P)H-dependent oxidoreductase n=1 Tax=Leptobacterium flavescens TaxID=472055 RepID=A0A6P0UIX4_9FLAO|nr:NAD(P)H-dependent oxidoreductase [Leptobacterium flavescens]NER12330.1 NAD(P)H-dependent oxidoreductase [Leptobacterium flavescens]